MADEMTKKRQLFFLTKTPPPAPPLPNLLNHYKILIIEFPSTVEFFVLFLFSPGGIMRRRTLFLCFLIVVAFVVYTIHVSRQSNLEGIPPTSSPAPTTSSTASSSSSPTPQPDPSPPPQQVKNLWKPGGFQNGVQLYWHTSGTMQYQQAAADRVLDYIVDLGANAVGITFPIYTDGAYPTRVYAGANTPRPDSLALVVEAAQARGLRVSLRPTIDEQNIATDATPLSWRGSIQPAQPLTWFDSYGDVLEPYAKVAARYNVEEFVVGTELSSLQAYGDSWQRLNRRLVAAGYNGILSYAFNWNGYSPMPFSALGIDAYPEINLDASASIVQLTTALRGWFNQFPLPIRERMVTQEVGIAAIAGMYPNPWQLGSSSDPLSPEIQEHWFTAMCQAVRLSRLQGVYYWVIDSNVDPKNPDLTLPTDWIGRPAEQSIRRCFASD